ncbi:MptD family putative ECF transporter S component [Streptococcus dysgalactiae]|uniref:MptD family putative ECF transporter S component n=2 Tax=Streptococcus dysgalactiae TaxID=1334 RepID=UPI003530A815
MKNLSTKGSNKMKKEVNQNRLNGKDLMNVGIFTAINGILGVVVAVAIGLTPIGFMMIPFVAAIIMGIPMMLYFTKIKKFGMILIFELVNGIVLLLTGMGSDALICGVVIGLIVEFIIKSGDYRSAKRAVFGYALLMLTSCANYIHWLNASAEWLNKNAATYGQDFMYTISGWLDYWWMFPAVILSAFIGGILGGLLGRAVLKKHFLRSGLV